MRKTLLIMLLGLGLIGCLNGNGGNNPPTPQPTPPPAPIPQPPQPPIVTPQPPIVTPQPPAPIPQPPQPPIIPPVTPIASSTLAIVDTNVFTLFTKPAPHQDYYVAQIKGASDTNDGLAPIKTGTHGPWLTLNKAAWKVIAGDIVHVGSGVYAETITVVNNGTALTPIRFYAMENTHPQVQSIYLKGSHYLEFYGFTVVGTKVLPSNWIEMPTVLIDDSSVGAISPNGAWSVRQPLINKKYATYTHIVQNILEGPNYSAFSAGIWLHGCDHIAISSNTISLHTAGIDADNSSSQLVIDNNAVFHCESGISSNNSGYSDSVVTHNHCYQNFNSGINLSSSQRITVFRNLCEYNALSQFTVSNNSSNCLLQHNVGQYGGYYTETMPFPGSSTFDFYSVGPGNVADSNYAAFQHDVTGNDGNGFIADTSSNPVKFTNNIAYYNWGGGITFTLTQGNWAINNTLIGNGFNGVPTSSGGGIKYSTTGNTIINNIFLGNRNCGIHGNGSLSSQTVDYNLYSLEVPAIHDSYNAGVRVFQTAKDVAKTGQEIHGISANPLLNNFTPQLLSPAIAAANSQTAPSTDYYGKSRHSIPDLGAVEH